MISVVDPWEGTSHLAYIVLSRKRYAKSELLYFKYIISCRLLLVLLTAVSEQSLQRNTVSDKQDRNALPKTKC